MLRIMVYGAAVNLWENDDSEAYVVDKSAQNSLCTPKEEVWTLRNKVHGSE